MDLTEKQTNALTRVLRQYGYDEHKNFVEQGQPTDHVFRDLALLAPSLPPIDKFWTGEYRRFAEQLERNSVPAPEEAAPTPDENDYGSNRDHPNGGKGGPDINWRWAKETVGLAALELNKAYEQFVVSDEGWETPNGSLQCAAKLLNEAMQRLGIADPDRDFPF